MRAMISIETRKLPEIKQIAMKIIHFPWNVVISFFLFHFLCAPPYAIVGIFSSWNGIEST